MSEDLDKKLALLREQTRAKTQLQEQRHSERQEQLILQKELKNEGQAQHLEDSIEVIKLKHQLDPEVRERDRDDKVFYENLDIQKFFKTEQLQQNHRLEEIHHTTIATIMEKAIIMLLGAKIEEKGRAGSHGQIKDKITHETDQQMRIEEFRAELAMKYGQEKADEMMNFIKKYGADLEKEFKENFPEE